MQKQQKKCWRKWTALQEIHVQVCKKVHKEKAALTVFIQIDVWDPEWDAWAEINKINFSWKSFSPQISSIPKTPNGASSSYTDEK